MEPIKPISDDDITKKGDCYFIPVEGINVIFPYMPYQTQRDYMQSVVRTLRGSYNALLESPTGTGKTLSLLCGTLAWLQSSNGAQSVIYYTSRTHMQLSQAAKELKRSAYARNPSVVLGSRVQMCLNKEVREQAGGDHLINRACRNAITKNACTYYQNYEQKMEVLEVDGVNDIEDLHEFGSRHQCCPYYTSKKLAESKASVVFMPYNYLVDTSVRKSTQLKLEKSVIIFDEAHNIEGVFKDAVSGSFTESCLSVIQESCLKLPEKVSDALMRENFGLSRSGLDTSLKRSENGESNPKKHKRDKEIKLNPIEELSVHLTNEKLQQVNKSVELLKEQVKTMRQDNNSDMKTLIHILKESGFEFKTSSNLITILESMASFWSIAGVMSPSLVAKYVTATSNLSQFISLLFPQETISLERHNKHLSMLEGSYTVYLKALREPSVVLKTGTPKDWELNLWCLDAAVGLKRVISDTTINGPRSLIVTSGTLAPMVSMEQALRVKFSIKREFKHVINEDQLKIKVIGESPNLGGRVCSYPLLSHFEATKKPEYLVALGESLKPLLRILPYGTLVFFPSYGLMNRAVNSWRENSSTWIELTQICPIHVEGKNQETFLNNIHNFKKEIDSTNNNRKSVFLGVCRGKLSEGVNLSGNYCRTVILVGLPFPSLMDPKIVSTRKFHEKKDFDKDGRIWYTQQMTRALNQTIGRVIRSKDDYGMLIMLDPRFKEFRYNISEWTRPFFPSDLAKWGDIETDVKTFFTKHGVSIKETAVAKIGAFELSFSSKSGGSQASSTASSRQTNNVYGNRMVTSTPLTHKRQSTQPQGRQQPSSSRSSLSSQTTPNSTTPNGSIGTISQMLKQRNKTLTQKSQPTRPKGNGVVVCPGVGSRFSLASAVQQSRELSIQRQQTLNISAQNSQASALSQNTCDYSIYQQSKGQPVGYKCGLCLGKAVDPVRTYCKCARVGCKTCMRILNNKSCGKCGIYLRHKEFKPLLFKSAVLTSQRHVVNIE